MFSNSAFVALVLHLTLLAGQMRSGTLSADGPRDTAGRDTAALRISVEGALGERLPAGEVAYLERYLQAATGGQDGDNPQELQVSQLAALLIQGMERETCAALTGFSTFCADLCAHLRPMLLRITRRERIDNPQMDAIRTQSPALWDAVRQVCDEAAHTQCQPAIPDEEAGFLAMHFGAVLEECEKVRRRLRAVVVCPIGIATSRFLTSQLFREFPLIAVERMCPMRGLDTDALRREGISLILSTVPLRVDFPHIVISMVLQEKDRILLQNAIDKFQRQSAAAQAVPTAPSAADLRYTGALSVFVVELLDTLTIYEVAAPRTRCDLIRYAARLFSSVPCVACRGKDALIRREALGDTYIAPLRALFLHRKSDAVTGCRLGYLRPAQPLMEDEYSVLGAIVMLAPNSPKPVWQQVMQWVSAVLIDRPALL